MSSSNTNFLATNHHELVPSVRHEQKKRIQSISSSTFVWFVAINIFFIFCFSLSACGSKKFVVQEIAIERDGQQVAMVKAEIARTREERAQGLMHRKKLPDGEGMLFVFERDEVQSFWMKNTLIPLSIAYIASNGRIIEIKDMYPLDESPVPSRVPVRYALEVPQGWFSRAGIKPGDVLLLTTIH